MNRIATLVLFITLSAALLGLGNTAFARAAPVTYNQVIRESPIAIVGEVTAVNETGNAATVKVIQTLKGQTQAQTLTVTPIKTIHCALNFLDHKVGEQHIFFGSIQAPGVLTLPWQARATMPFASNIEKKRPYDINISIEAAKKLIQANDIEDPLKRTLAILELAAIDNLQIQTAVFGFFYEDDFVKISRENQDTYLPVIIKLLDQELPTAQKIGICALGGKSIPQALPRLIELSKSSDPGIVSNAMQALRRYPEQAWLPIALELAKHTNPGVRAAALIALSDSNDIAAKEALQAAQSDPDPSVRRIVGP